MTKTNFVVIQKSDNETELSEIYLSVTTEGREWLVEPATLSADNTIAPTGAPFETINPHDEAVSVFRSHRTAAAFIIRDDERVKFARRAAKAPQAEREAKPETAKPEPVNDNTDENQNVPDHVRLDMEIAGREMLVKAVAEIRRVGGHVVAFQFKDKIGVEYQRSRRILYALAEMEYGHLKQHGDFTMYPSYMGPKAEVAYRIAN